MYHRGKNTETFLDSSTRRSERFSALGHTWRGRSRHASAAISAASRFTAVPFISLNGAGYLILPYLFDASYRGLPAASPHFFMPCEILFYMLSRFALILLLPPFNGHNTSPYDRY